MFHKIFPITRSRPEEQGLDLAFSELFEIFEFLETRPTGPVRNALQAVLLRLIEVGLLHDAEILRIGGLWFSLGDSAAARLRRRIAEILDLDDHEVPDTLLEYVIKVLRGSALQRGRREVDYGDYFSDMVERAFNETGSKRLHCANCGYHFMEADVGPDRRRQAYELGSIFAAGHDQLRENNRDRWKPVRIDTTGDSNRFLTRLTIDHIVPEEGFGWSDLDNLEIVCQFCNQGKLIYRHSLEAISLFAASGMSDYPGDRGWSVLKQTTVSFTFELYGRTCWQCNAKASTTELTVRRRKLNSGGTIRSEAFAPWNMVCLCYKCVSMNSGAWHAL